MATTTIYDPATNPDLSALNFLGYQQLPTPSVYVLPLSASPDFLYTPVPNLLESAIIDTNGITLDTNGTAFSSVPELDFDTLLPTLSTFPADANTGYAGFTNYTINDLDEIDVNDILAGTVDLNQVIESLTFETVNPSFPVLDPDVGFTLSFDLSILEEESAANRAGFSLLVVTNDPSKEIELGFKRENGADRVFAQSANFQEAEDFSGSTLDLGSTATYSLSVSGDSYTLATDGVEILSGDLRDYNFDPTSSEPALPEAANPYEIPNLIFLGDNTDQAYAEFTLGEVSISTSDSELIPTPDPGSQLSGGLFDYEQFLRLQNPTATIPTDAIDGLPLAQFFDEAYYRALNPDVAAAVSAGIFASGYEHFVLFGVAEGRNPSVLYDEAFYLANNSDVAQAVTAGVVESGLQHFLNFGHEENRDPSSQFDQSDYLTNNPDVAAAIDGGVFQSAFEHYIEFGADENRIPALSLYNEAYYLQNNPDVAAAVANGIFADGFEHFVSSGQGESRSPSSLFNEASYRSLNPDVNAAVAAGVFSSGFEHYGLFGRFEGRTTI